MTAGIVGLGLIGGSFARAYSAAGHTVLGFDTNAEVLGFAKLCGAIDMELTKENIKVCDIVLVCVYPEAAITFMEEFGPYIGNGPIVIDCCGTKRKIFEAAGKIAERFGFTYVGGHPMAGTQYSGFKYSKQNLFQGAPMVLVTKKSDDIVFLSHVKELLRPAGFGKISVTTADKHDEMIAFTSQLAHVVSNAYVKSPTAKEHSGFSAGSYKDMTRVAWLNPQMWAELFLENKEYLLNEIDTLIENLSQYREAIEKGEKEQLVHLLEDGKRIKEEIDG